MTREALSAIYADPGDLFEIRRLGEGWAYLSTRKEAGDFATTLVERKEDGRLPALPPAEQGEMYTSEQMYGYARTAIALHAEPAEAKVEGLEKALADCRLAVSYQTSRAEKAEAEAVTIRTATLEFVEGTVDLSRLSPSQREQYRAALAAAKGDE